MNRRNFISSLAAAVAGIGTFNILPGAGRVWRAEAKIDYWFIELPAGWSRLLNIQQLPKYDRLVGSEQMAARMADAMLAASTATFLPNLGETRRAHNQDIVHVVERTIIKPTV